MKHIPRAQRSWLLLLPFAFVSVVPLIGHEFRMLGVDGQTNAQTAVSGEAKRLLTLLKNRLDEIAASKSETGLKFAGDLALTPLVGLRRETLREALGSPSVDCRVKPNVVTPTGERGRIAPCQADEELVYSFYRLPKGFVGGGTELLVQFGPNGICVRALWRKTQ